VLKQTNGLFWVLAPKKREEERGKKDKVLLCFQKERKLYKYFPKVEFLS
jgi:hypothetical protein